jgi:hypothetical protein
MVNLGEVKILFGKVIDISDTDKLFRCRISITGFTDEISKDDLPWYFPWFGITYLPELNDIVPVLVFDENFSTCFYGKKVDSKLESINDTDYENYLEIFRRKISDKNVQLTYTKTNGIEFINDTGKLQIETAKITLFVGSNSISIDKDKIYLGDKNHEPATLGDKTVKQLEDMVTHQNNVIIEMMKMFLSIVSSSAPNPFTAPIGAALAPLVTAAQAALTPENAKVKASAKTIKSKKVFVE